MKRALLIRALPALFGLSLVACQQGSGDAPASTTPATAQPSGGASSSSGGSNGAIADDAVVATWEGGQLTYGDIRTEIQGQLSKMEMDYLQGLYQLQSQATDQFAIKAVLDLEAASAGTDVEGLLKVQIEDKVPQPTEAEIEETYPMVKRQLRNAPLEQVRDQVAGYILQRRQGEAMQAYVEELRTKYKVELSVPYPELPRIQVDLDDDPVKGPDDAVVTIVEFGDYECPYCGKATEAVRKVMEEYEGKVKLVYRDFPLSFHARAIPAAIAANCAEEQGKYWEMHDLLLDNQRALTDADFDKYVTQLELDADKWKTCYGDVSKQEEVQKDFMAGQALGVSGTPAFFVNGVFLNGAVPYEQFKAIIESELADAG